MGTSPAAGQLLFFEGGPPALRIERFTAGENTASATDASVSLSYERATESGRDRKVTVEALSGPARFGLSVEAADPTDGVGLSPVTLRRDRPPEDLLRDIPPCNAPSGSGRACEGQTILRYRLQARIGDRPGRAEYTVRYTLLTQ